MKGDPPVKSYILDKETHLDFALSFIMKKPVYDPSYSKSKF